MFTVTKTGWELRLVKPTGTRMPMLIYECCYLRYTQRARAELMVCREYAAASSWSGTLRFILISSLACDCDHGAVCTVDWRSGCCEWQPAVGLVIRRHYGWLLLVPVILSQITPVPLARRVMATLAYLIDCLKLKGVAHCILIVMFDGSSYYSNGGLIYVATVVGLSFNWC